MTTDEKNGARIPALRPVLIVGALLTLGAAIAFDVHTAVSTAAGVAVAVLDLWVITRMVTIITGIDPSQQGSRWAPVVLVKFLVLFSGVIILLSLKVILPLPFLAGLGALPIGIVIQGLFPG
ncbi:ATP synthase subunit I [Pendulispora brunnea]|uniref:ATP synthase subunit I n=1 Tax=Pendulispora brunnea TaxID=2905690 RepID=A0ABZ2K8E9_9BACT